MSVISPCSTWWPWGGRTSNPRSSMILGLV